MSTLPSHGLATHLTMGPVEFKSFAICGIDGTNVPDTNTTSLLSSCRLGSLGKHVLGMSPDQHMSATIVRFSLVLKRLYTSS